MTVADIMANFSPSKTATGIQDVDKYVLAIAAPLDSEAVTAGDFLRYSVLELGVTGYDAQLNAQSETSHYIRQGESTTKTGTQRTFSVKGHVYVGDPALDHLLSKKVKYGTGEDAIVDYLFFNVSTGLGESGRATALVNSDASGNAGEPAGFSVELQKNGAAPDDFDYLEYIETV